MTYKLDTIESDKSLADLQSIIQNQEEHNGFTLVALSTTVIGGVSKTVATFRFAKATGTVTLTPVDGTLDLDGQEDAIGAVDGEVVCYATISVGRTPRNVLATRA